MKKLSDLGERRAIQVISSLVSKGDAAVGIGDDCAALAFGDEYVLVTTDMMTRRTHIPPGMTSFQIGWFAVAINLSDIAAKGGEPLGVVLSLGLPATTSEVFLKEFMTGADACAIRFGTSIIGGDTKENTELTICGTAVGKVRKNEFMPRKGAQPGDVVAVTGELGKAAAGYLALKSHVKKPGVLKGLFEPVPRIREGRVLAQSKVVSSCMDISDGLSSSLYQLRELNKVGFEIDAEKIPVSSLLTLVWKQLKKDAVEYAVHFGGDYELLVVVPSSDFYKARKVVEKTGTFFTAIGVVTKGKDISLVFNGRKKILENKGYEHFKKHVF